MSSVEEPLWKRSLIDKRCDIVRILDVNDIIDYLIGKNVVTIDKSERIRAPMGKLTRSERVGELLDYLGRRPEADYKLFVESLKEPYESLYKTLKVYQEKQEVTFGLNSTNGKPLTTSRALFT